MLYGEIRLVVTWLVLVELAFSGEMWVDVWQQMAVGVDGVAVVRRHGDTLVVDEVRAVFTREVGRAGRGYLRR